MLHLPHHFLDPEDFIDLTDHGSEHGISHLEIAAAYTSRMKFEWDPEKAAGNLAKHGVGFIDASTIFGDPLELTLSDPDHSEDEFRFLSLGTSSAGRLLVVSYTERGTRIRIISAREATPRERRQYESAKA